MSEQYAGEGLWLAFDEEKIGFFFIQVFQYNGHTRFGAARLLKHFCISSQWISIRYHLPETPFSAIWGAPEVKGHRAVTLDPSAVCAEASFNALCCILPHTWLTLWSQFCMVSHMHKSRALFAYVACVYRDLCMRDECSLASSGSVASGRFQG